MLENHGSCSLGSRHINCPSRKGHHNVIQNNCDITELVNAMEPQTGRREGRRGGGEKAAHASIKAVPLQHSPRW